MDNPTIARLLAETADLLEIDGGDSFRIRSYRRAAEAAAQTTVDLTAAAPSQRPGRCRFAKNCWPNTGLDYSNS